MRNSFRLVGCVSALLFVLLLPVRAASAASAAEEYNSMVAASHAMPANFDFGKLRELYKQLPGTSVDKPMIREDYAAFFKRLGEKDASVGKDVGDYSDKYFALAEVHTRAFVVFKELNQTPQADYQTWAFRGLTSALMNSGDGHSAATAYHALNVSEEYLIARQRMESKGQKLIRQDGQVFDVLQGVSNTDKQPMEIWFNVTWSFAKPAQ